MSERLGGCRRLAPQRPAPPEVHGQSGARDRSPAAPQRREAIDGQRGDHCCGNEVDDAEDGERVQVFIG